MFEYKSFQGGIKDVNTVKGIVSGYFASFDTVDRAKDLIQKGAFAKTIRENGPKGTGDIAHLQDHDKKKTVGMLLDLNEDNKGVPFESKLGRHAAGRNYLLMCEDGFIKSHSFEYRVIKSEKKDGIRLIKELQMTEGSGLQHGIAACNPNTPLTGIKSLELLTDTEKTEYIFEQLALYQKAWKGGNYTDQHFVEVILPNLKSFAQEAELIIKSVEASEAEPITSKNYNPTAIEISNQLKKAFKI